MEVHAGRGMLITEVINPLAHLRGGVGGGFAMSAKLEQGVCRSFFNSFNRTDNQQRRQHIWKYPK